MGLACVVRTRVANVPASGSQHHRRSGPAYVVQQESDHVERGKVATPPGPAMPGKPTARQADGGAAMRKSEQANALR